jgi:DNA-binding NtrC family response regulator
MPRKPSILIVDDEVSITRTLSMVFEQDGYEVHPAYSAAEAIRLLHNGHNVDAVITDLNMEAEDIGLKVAAEAAGLRPRPVVVICTGFASVKNAEQALHMHVDYLATKPVDLDELKSALGRLIRRSASEISE